MFIFLMGAIVGLFWPVLLKGSGFLVDVLSRHSFFDNHPLVGVDHTIAEKSKNIYLAAVANRQLAIWVRQPRPNVYISIQILLNNMNAFYRVVYDNLFSLSPLIPQCLCPLGINAQTHDIEASPSNASTRRHSRNRSGSGHNPLIEEVFSRLRIP